MNSAKVKSWIAMQGRHFIKKDEINPKIPFHFRHPIWQLIWQVFFEKKDGYLILILKRISSSELLWNVAFNTEFVFFYSQHIKLPNLLKLAWFLNKEIIRLGDLEDMFPRYSINQMDNAVKRLLNSKNFINYLASSNSR